MSCKLYFLIGLRLISANQFVNIYDFAGFNFMHHTSKKTRITKAFTSFCAWVSLLAIVAISVLALAYVQHFPDAISAEETHITKSIRGIDAAFITPKLTRSMKQGKLHKAHFTASFDVTQSTPAYYHLSTKHCFSNLHLNGVLINVPSIAKGCKKSVRLNFSRHLDILKESQNRLDVDVYTIGSQPAKLSVLPLVATDASKIIYGIVGIFMAWGGAIILYTIIRQRYYQGLFFAPITPGVNIAALLIISTLALVLRMNYLPVVSHDMHHVLLKWYGQLQAHGFGAMKRIFYDYAPTYLYMMGIVEWLFPNMPPVRAIKLISIIADMAVAVLAYKLVLTTAPRYAQLCALAAFSAVLFSPMIYINSAMWGQCDVLHSGLILLSLYGFSQKRDMLAMVAFSLAMCIKLQAIFFAPVIVILWLHRKFHWSLLLLPFAFYGLSVIPAVLMGTNVEQALMTHVKHVNHYSKLAMAVSNPYMFISNSYYAQVMPIGIALTMFLLAAIASAQLRYESQWDAKSLLLLATLILAVCPFFLPKMLDRYFYCAALCSIPLAMIYWRALPAAIALNLAALGYPFGFIPNPLDTPGHTRQQIAVGVNGFAIAYLCGLWVWRLRKYELKQVQ